MSIAEELGTDAEIVIYRKDPPDAATLRQIIAKLEEARVMFERLICKDNA